MTFALESTGMERGADFSSCGQYRYTLTRRWGEGPPLLWIMLNPSTADAEQDDPTVRRLIAFTKREEYSALEVVNLYAFRATDPRELARAADPVGPLNDHAIREAFGRAALVVAAWGGRAKVARSWKIEAMAEAHGALWCLGRTAAGHPRHPLYVLSAQPLALYRAGMRV